MTETLAIQSHEARRNTHGIKHKIGLMKHILRSTSIPSPLLFLLLPWFCFFLPKVSPRTIHDTYKLAFSPGQSQPLSQLQIPWIWQSNQLCQAMMNLCFLQSQTVAVAAIRSLRTFSTTRHCKVLHSLGMIYDMENMIWWVLWPLVPVYTFGTFKGWICESLTWTCLVVGAIRETYGEIYWHTPPKSRRWHL